jgi:hypothetical protein
MKEHIMVSSAATGASASESCDLSIVAATEPDAGGVAMGKREL